MKSSFALRVLALSSVATALLTLSASAVTVLTFEGVGNNNLVNNFYDGGAGGSLGIGFVSGQGLVSSAAGGTGNFSGEPSPSTILYFLAGGAATMNVTAGFNTGFSFFYTSATSSGFVKVYDGFNGSGSLLASIQLNPTGNFSTFVPIGVTFAGTAKSVDFGGVANGIGFDDVTIGSQNAGGGGHNVPDAGTTLSLLAVALGGLGLAKRKLG
jgi:hypothetical protein